MTIGHGVCGCSHESLIAGRILRRMRCLLQVAPTSVFRLPSPPAPPTTPLLALPPHSLTRIRRPTVQPRSLNARPPFPALISYRLGTHASAVHESSTTTVRSNRRPSTMPSQCISFSHRLRQGPPLMRVPVEARCACARRFARRFIVGLDVHQF